ncbi:MAG: sensor histidine kinase [Planctomycetota bacterium]
MSPHAALAPPALQEPTLGGPWEPLFQTLAESVPTAVLVTDLDGHVLIANRNFRFLFPVDARPLEGAQLSEFLPPRFASFFEELLLDTLHAGGCLERPLPELSHELGALRYLVGATVAGEDALASVVFILRDVSAGLQLSSLREQDRVKQYLLSTLFHDLKSPLAAILNAAEILPDLMPADSAEGCRELLAAIESSGSRIQQLVDDTSEYFKLRFPSRSESRTPIDLTELLGSLVALYKTQGHTQRFVLDFQGPATVCGERLRLTRAFDNLISNAVKYAPGNGEIRVRVEPDSDDHVCVLIADQGPGIPEQFLAKIWEPFYRIPNSKREGTGLGLSITRHIIEEQRGSVAVDSRPGTGTTFIVRMPSAG